MRAVRYSRYGGPEVLEVVDLPVPAPGPGEVRVHVLAAAVGGGEQHIRAGRYRRLMRQTLPAGSGVDFVGRVAQAGAGTAVDDDALVWGVMPHGTFGAIAEEVVVPGSRVAPAPTTVTPEAAAALPSSGTTALRAIDDLGAVRPGTRVLVRGASGGVGNLAVQIALVRGAHVTALAGADSLPWLRELGVHEALDHRTTAAADLGPFDLVVDLVGTDLWTYRRRLVPGGTLAALALDPAHPFRVPALLAVGALGRRRIRGFSNNPTPAALGTLTAMVDRGEVTPAVDTVLPMDRIVEAHRLLEAGGRRGKIVVTPTR